MQVLKFKEKSNRYVITVITSADTHDLWNRFKGRVIEDNDNNRTASTYCEYESSSEGLLYLLRYDLNNANNECISNSENESKVWKGFPPVMFETGGMYHFHIKLYNIKGNARFIHPLKDVTDCFEYVETGNYTGLLTGVVNFLNQPGTFVLRFDYTDKDGIHHDDNMSMEVVSPKLDTKHDLLEIKRLIEQEYENYVYQYLALTYQNQSIQRIAINVQFKKSIIRNLITSSGGEFMNWKRCTTAVRMLTNIITEIRFLNKPLTQGKIALLSILY